MKRRMLGYAVSCVLASALLTAVCPLRAQDPPYSPYPAYGAGSQLSPAPPQYLVLAPRGCGQAQPLPAQTYAYGWFGVAPRQHTTWHTDYYGYLWKWH